MSEKLSVKIQAVGVSDVRGGEMILEIMDEIEEEKPLSCEFETDARYIWPERWDRLRERVGEMDEAAKAVKETLECIFGQDDPDEASPEERRTGREIKEIAAMILQESGGKK